MAITGGAGFIGSNLILYLISKYPEYEFVNIDCLTYAGNLSNLSSIEDNQNYHFEKVDIANKDNLGSLFEKYQFDGLIHLAAETHVDRSIISPEQFINTNIIGTFNLLELSQILRDKNSSFRFYHISTDEVYGSIETDFATELSAYNPSSPYAAAKASSDHLVRAYNKTYGLDVVISNCTNNYGPLQFPEKLIPLVINNIIHKKEIPIYGNGKQERDWLFVTDHCRAIDMLFHKGKSGEIYNIASGNLTTNLKLVESLCEIIDNKGISKNSKSLIKFIKDRPGHDFRYALDSSKIANELNWSVQTNLNDGLKNCVGWYISNQSWLENCISGDYLNYYEKVYSKR
ncbi:MAG: dTDP-glucose 4,6-dehydratase [candidate division Zixibacteria bacterium]|nr:dTDP-glucose 4,6-dehydratase [candidate division Zixibacteria bacterium]